MTQHDHFSDDALINRIAAGTCSEEDLDGDALARLLVRWRAEVHTTPTDTIWGLEVLRAIGLQETQKTRWWWRWWRALRG
jgi:hypothetical protein